MANRVGKCLTITARKEMYPITAIAGLLKEGQIGQDHGLAEVAGNTGYTTLGRRNIRIHDYCGTAKEVTQLAVIDKAVDEHDPLLLVLGATLKVDVT